MGHSNHWAELLELNGEVRRVEPTDVTLLVHFWYFLCSKTWYDGHRKMDWLPIKIFLPIYYNRWSVKWVNLIISDYWLWNLSRKHSPKQSSLQSRLVRENSCTCILLVWNFLICNILQAFDHEDLDDYQGDGQGKSSGITPEEYRSEPIVSQTLYNDIIVYYALFLW